MLGVVTCTMEGGISLNRCFGVLAGRDVTSTGPEAGATTVPFASLMYC